MQQLLEKNDNFKHPWGNPTRKSEKPVTTQVTSRQEVKEKEEEAREEQDLQPEIGDYSSFVSRSVVVPWLLCPSASIKA